MDLDAAVESVRHNDSSNYSFRPLSDKGLKYESSAFIPERLVNLISDFFSVHSIGKALVIVSEPGMGADAVLRLVASLWRSRGAYVNFGNFHTFTYDEVIAGLHKHVLSAIKSPKESRLIALDCPCVTSDKEAKNFVSELATALSDGVSCALVIRPECSRILTYLPDAVILGNSALRFSLHDIEGLLPEDCPCSSEEIFSSTQGISDLVSTVIEVLKSHPESLKTLKPSHITNISSFAAYTRSLIAESLRPSLSDDDLRLRLAMILLGSGTIDDAVEVVGGLENGFSGIHIDNAPLFNMSFDTNTFKCVYPATPESLNSCVSVLTKTAEGRFNVVANAVMHLSRKGDYTRATLIARRLGGNAVIRTLAFSAPFDLVGVGETSLIKKALAMHEVRSPRSAVIGRYAAEAALAWAENDWNTLAKIERSLPAANEEEEQVLVQQVRMAVASKIVTRELNTQSYSGLQNLEEYSQNNAKDPISKIFAEHATIIASLFQGKYEYALQIALQAIADIRYEEKQSRELPIYYMMLESDFLAVQTLVGEQEKGVCSFSNPIHINEGTLLQKVLETRTLIHQALCLVQRDSTDTTDVERAIAVFERTGQNVLASALLIACAVADITDGAKVRAFVRCQKAAELAQKANARFLWRQAALIASVIEINLGNEIKGPIADITEDVSWHDKEIGPIEWVLSALVRSNAEDLAHSASRLRTVRLPLEWVFVLKALLQMEGMVSETLIHALPTRWRAALIDHNAPAHTKEDKNRNSEHKETKPSGLKQRETHVRASGSGGMPLLRINMLGGFEILKGDTPIPESAWKRKGAKVLLALLAVVEGHAMTRAEAVSALWPNCDYLVGRDRLYVTLGALRKALGQSSAPGGYIEGSDGRLWLNMANVTCDIDEFEKACDHALSHVENDAITIQKCLNVRELYAGDLVAMGDATGIMQARREEERRRFVDVMVEGAEASLRQGSPTRAEWFARNAHHADSLREDVIEAELKALFAQGRTVEAHREYERYAQGLIEVTGLPPSSSMRHLMKEAESMVKPHRKRSA